MNQKTSFEARLLDISSGKSPWIKESILNKIPWKHFFIIPWIIPLEINE